MKRWIIYGLLVLGAYLVVLVATLPASRVYQLAAATLPPSIQLYGLKGSLWSGSADTLVLASQRYRNARWQLQPLSLLSGAMVFELDLDNGASLLQGRAGVDIFGNLILRNVSLQQDLGDIQALAQVAPISLGGKISGRIDAVKMSRRQIASAQANFTLRDVAFLLPRRTPWGDFKLDIEKPDSDTLVKVRDQGGPLRADGLITIDDANQYQINIALEAAADASPDLIQGLNYVGPRGGDGKTRLTNGGSLTQLLGGDSGQAPASGN